MTHRQRVKRQYKKLKRRLERLFKAEKNRDQITAKRKKIYLRRRKFLGDRNPQTKRALRSYRESLRLSRKVDATEETLRKRAEKKLEFLHDNPPGPDPDGDGLMRVDGVLVSVGIGKEVLRIRKKGVWKGHLVSGFRTPAHSTSLCMAMCGAPQCPGKCAGAASRHAQKGGRNGAVDLTDFITFARECVRNDSWLENHLPRDLVHFSDIGN